MDHFGVRSHNLAVAHQENGFFEREITPLTLPDGTVVRVNAEQLADGSILLVDARNGVLVQSRRHARIARLLGIQDFVLAINGHELDEKLNIYALLENTVGRQVVVTVAQDAAGKGRRDITVEPVGNTPSEFEKFIVADRANAGRLLKSLGIKPADVPN